MFFHVYVAFSCSLRDKVLQVPLVISLYSIKSAFCHSTCLFLVAPGALVWCVFIVLFSSLFLKKSFWSVPHQKRAPEPGFITSGGAVPSTLEFGQQTQSWTVYTPEGLWFSATKHSMKDGSSNALPSLQSDGMF